MSADRHLATGYVHDCPGCGQSAIPNHLLSCAPCWFLLPLAIRRRINRAYHGGPATVVDHPAAVAAALEWYKTNSSPPPRTAMMVALERLYTVQAMMLADMMRGIYPSQDYFAEATDRYKAQIFDDQASAERERTS